MIPIARVDEIAGEVARANLSQSLVEEVTSEASSDVKGGDALRITIVLKPGAATQLEGDKVLDTLVEIQERLQREGEERFAFVEYATREELADNGDS